MTAVWEIAEVTATSLAAIWEIAEVTVVATSPTSTAVWEIAEVSVTSSGAVVADVDSDADIADAGQIVTFTATGNAVSYTWAIASMTNGVSSPAITVAGDTMSATVRMPPTLTGSTLVMRMTPLAGAAKTATVTILAAVEIENVAGVPTPIFEEVLLP